MCGIAGYWRKDKAFHISELKDLTDSLTHRGPDAAGTYRDMGGLLGLGHRRLSILDLSEESNQPFFSKNGRYVMVFNGEVYNYADIAKRYQIQTYTTSDTEVILEHFSLMGMEAVKEWNGMFALAIWDRSEKRLYLIRDRIGKKPLYYFHDDNSLVFSSELKSICQVVSLKPDKDVIATYLHLGYLPKEHTIYQHVKRILPGHYACLSEQGLEQKSYWVLEEKILPEPGSFRNEGEAKKILRGLLDDAVSIRMVADVPVGTFLSGGVDSGIVTAVAQANSSKPVKTFSIGFDDPKYNEAPYAAAVARHLGTEHHEHIVSMQDALALAPELVDIYDEPFADSSAIPTLLVSKMARQEVTVILTGDGGDELFLGYGMYDWARRLDHPLVKALRRPGSWAMDAFGNDRMKRAAQVLDYPDEQRKKSHLFSQEQYLFSEREIQELLSPGISTDLLVNETPASLSRQLSAAEAQALFDMQYYLPDDLLVKVDRATMHHSLEGRCPLLDYRIIEYALNLPEDLRKKGNISKYLLKQVLYDLVPASYFDRPKWGFAVPMARWLQEDLSYLIDDYLSPANVQQAGLVQNEKVQALVTAFRQGRAYLYNRIWALIVLHQWYRKYGE